MGSQVLVMKPSPGTIDPFSGAAKAVTTYKVNNVEANQLSPETKPTEVRMKETITTGSNASAGSTNKGDPSDYKAAQYVDINTAQRGPSANFTQQYFIGNSNSPAMLLRPVDDTGMFDMGTKTHVIENYTSVSIGLEQ